MATKTPSTTTVAKATAALLDKQGFKVTRLNLLLGTSKNPVRVDVHCDNATTLERVCAIVNQGVIQRVDIYELIPSLATKGVLVPLRTLRSYETLDAFFAAAK